MNKQDEYLDNAARSFDLATRATSAADKSHLLDLAQKWLVLADRPPSAPLNRPEHPLVKRAFRALQGR
jgi:hypothetical protein